MSVPNGSVRWKALADPKRRRIVQLLQAQPLTTGDLCQHFDVSRYAVMKHLKVLEEAGMVMTERRGRQRWNFLNTSPLRTPPRPMATTPEASSPPENLGLLELNYASSFIERDAELLTRLSYTLTLKAEYTAVFQTIIHQINSWWTLRQWTNSAVHLEGYPGGRLYEEFPALHGQDQNNGLLYGFVTLWHAPRAFKIQGSFGADDVDATVHIQLRPTDSDKNCHLQLTQQFWRQPTQISLAVFEQSWAEMLKTISRKF